MYLSVSSFFLFCDSVVVLFSIYEFEKRTFLQKCSTDKQRISYVWRLPEAQDLTLRPSTSGKHRQEAESCEQLYDMLVANEKDAPKALEVIQRAIAKTPTSDKNPLAVR